VQQALFPDNSYRHDSGGDPAVIPDLTFEDFQQFHARYYHPSNGRFWFYGDDDPTKRLEVLDAYLSEFDARPADSAVETQAMLREPRRVEARYAAGEGGGEDGGDEEQKSFVAVNWVLADAPLDVETELALGFLDYLMLGTSAAPLRKALNDSGLGAALVGGGIDDELKQPIFSVGLKGVDAGDVDKVEALVLEKLAELRKTGFTASAIGARVFFGGGSVACLPSSALPCSSTNIVANTHIAPQCTNTHQQQRRPSTRSSFRCARTTRARSRAACR
jgi:Zn-dependent M16 (insulinase) family peptidase